MGTNWDASGYDSRHRYVFEFGENLVDELDAQPGQWVLDAGCGTGHLANQIASRGAFLVGVDTSPEMIAQARRNYPELEFEVADVAEYRTRRPFDAVFSNAALHWMKPPGAVAHAISGALKTGGRLIAEFGGRGNIASIIEATGRNDWYFPSIGEYASLLEANGLEVRRASLIDRPTQVAGDNGMRDWLAMFYHPALPADLVTEVEEVLRPKLFRDGSWHMDYRRLRVEAVRV